MPVDEELYSAIIANDLKRVKTLVKDNNINLTYAINRQKESPLTCAVNLRLTKIIDYLLTLNVDIDQTNLNDMTPLMVACCDGQVKGSKIALKLIANGANVNYVRESDEMTALKFAVGSCKPEVIQALIEKKADFNGPEGTDQTAFILAARYNDVDSLKILLDAGANPHIPCQLGWAKGLNALEVAKLEKSKKSIAFLSEIYGT